MSISEKGSFGFLFCVRIEIFAVTIKVFATTVKVSLKPLGRRREPTASGIDRFAQANAVGVAETGCRSNGAGLGANIAR